MDCAEAQDLISADLDGRLEDTTKLDQHLASCDTCRAWRTRARVLADRTRAMESEADPDLPVPRGFLAYRWIRVTLAWAGLLLIVWNFGGMIDGGTDESIQHLWRHQHAFGVALGLTFIFVAWRPDRAYGLVPVAATFTVALGGAALIDVMNGSTPASREAKHLVEIIGLGMLWLLGWSAGPGRSARRKAAATDRSA